MNNENHRPEGLKAEIDVLIEFLTEDGFRPKLTDSGNVMFKREGKLYHIDFDDQDPTFAMMIAPNIQSNSPECSLESQLAAAAQVARDIKAAKIAVYANQSVNATVEGRYTRMDHFTGVMMLLLSNLDAAVSKFHKLIEVEPESAEQVIDRCKS